MMNNLFSMFDPSSYIISISWLIISLLLILVLKPKKNLKMNMNLLLSMVISKIKMEMQFSLKNMKKSETIIILSLFTVILFMNFSALYPYLFSPTSHLAINLPLSILVWLSVINLGWTNNSNHMLSHLVPQGTPSLLMPFMVLIEVTSNVIRPITLCVRLTANLIAGHMLMGLLGDALTSLNYISSLLSIFTPIILTVLESAVSFIQAYVFITLATLYLDEIS